jgi:hypothetical protein
MKNLLKISDRVNQIKILTIKKEMVLLLAQFSALMGAATLAPLLGQQAVTGPLVNAVLFISVVLLGNQAAVLIALIPSLIALSVGFLPAVLAPMVPFIMMGNVVLILTFAYSRERNYCLGVIFASVFKFLFLFGTGSIVVNLIIKKEIASKAAMMMSWPQLLTALAGGLIAYLFLKSIRRV